MKIAASGHAYAAARQGQRNKNRTKMRPIDLMHSIFCFRRRKITSRSLPQIQALEPASAFERRAPGQRLTKRRPNLYASRSPSFFTTENRGLRLTIDVVNNIGVWITLKCSASTRQSY